MKTINDLGQKQFALRILDPAHKKLQDGMQK